MGPVVTAVTEATKYSQDIYWKSYLPPHMQSAFFRTQLTPADLDYARVYLAAKSEGAFKRLMQAGNYLEATNAKPVREKSDPQSSNGSGADP